MNRKLIVICMFFLIFFSGSLTVSASSGWRAQGKAFVDTDGIVLTKKFTTYNTGVYSKDVPIDTRNGFRLTFNYWVGDVYAKSKNGFKFIMSTEPIKDYGVSFKGYKQYFHAVHFASYEGRKGDITIKQNAHDKVTNLSDEYTFKISDDTWHSVEIRYGNRMMSIWVDGKAIHQNISCVLPNLVYVGFDASTPIYGSQKHMIANVNLEANDACRVNLNKVGGVCEETYIYAVPNAATTFPIPTKKYHTFLGWYTGVSGGTRVDGTAYGFYNNQTVYARWKDNRYRVLFDPNKGKVAIHWLLRLKGERLDSLPTPKRSRYTFVGWYTKKSGGKKISSDYVVKKNVKFYAHWIKNTKKIKVSLNKNGGSCKKSSYTIKITGKFKKLPKATRKGYTFLGWYTKKSGGIKVTASTKMKDIYPLKKLYAHWRKGGSGSSVGSNNKNDKQSVLDCTSCKGSGDCSTCGGDGYLWSSASRKEDRNCYKCNRSGKCTTCGGTGKR